jgi:hypothetical protein
MIIFMVTVFLLPGLLPMPSVFHGEAKPASASTTAVTTKEGAKKDSAEGAHYCELSGGECRHGRACASMHGNMNKVCHVKHAKGKDTIAAKETGKEVVHTKEHAHHAMDTMDSHNSSKDSHKSHNKEEVSNSKKTTAPPSCEIMISCADTGDDSLISAASEAPFLRGVFLISSLNNGSKLYMPETSEPMDKAPLKNFKPPRLP